MDLYRSVAAILTIACLGALVVLTTSVQAYPKPALATKGTDLTFEPGPLRLRQSQEDGKWYWYMTYSVSNFTDKDRIWAPTFTLFTDRGDILESGVRWNVENEYISFLGGGLLTQHEMIDDLMQGKGNAKSGLVMWPAVHTNVNELVLFVAGISTESTVIQNPVSGKDVTLQKTRMREYLIPGRAKGLGDDPVMLHPDLDRTPRWIFR